MRVSSLLTDLDMYSTVGGAVYSVQCTVLTIRHYQHYSSSPVSSLAGFSIVKKPVSALWDFALQGSLSLNTPGSLSYLGVPSVNKPLREECQTLQSSGVTLYSDLQGLTMMHRRSIVFSASRNVGGTC